MSTGRGVLQQDGKSFDKLAFPSHIKIPSDQVHEDCRSNFLIENVRYVLALPIPCIDGLGLCDDASSLDDWREVDLSRVDDYSKNRTRTSDYDVNTQSTWENIILKESFATFVGLCNMSELGTPNYNWRRLCDIKSDKDLVTARKEERHNASTINPLYHKASGKRNFYYHRRVQKRMKGIMSGKELEGEECSDEEENDGDGAKVDWIHDHENTHYKEDPILQLMEDSTLSGAEDFYANMKDVAQEEIERGRVSNFEKINYALGGKKSSMMRRKTACIIQAMKRNVVLSSSTTERPTVKEEKVGYILYLFVFDPLMNLGEGIEELIKHAATVIDKKSPEHLKTRYAGRGNKDTLRTFNMEKWIGLVVNYMHFIQEAEQNIRRKKGYHEIEDDDGEEEEEEEQREYTDREIEQEYRSRYVDDEDEVNCNLEYYNDKENQSYWEHSAETLLDETNPLNPKNVWTVENAYKYFAGKFDAVVPRLNSIRKKRADSDRETWDFTRMRFANQSWYIAESDNRRNIDGEWKSGPKMVNTHDGMDAKFFKTVYFCRTESMLWNDFDNTGRNLGLKNRYFPWIRDGWNTKLFLQTGQTADGGKAAWRRITEKKKMDLLLKQKVIQTLPSMRSSQALMQGMTNAAYELPESIFADRNWFILLKTKTSFYRDVVESHRPKGFDYKSPQYMKEHEEFCRKRELFVQTIGPFFQERVWTQDALVSDFMKAIIQYTKTPEFIKFRHTFHINRADMDPFGQYLMFELKNCRYTLLAVNNPNNLHVISFGMFDAYRMEWNLHFSIMSTGPNSQGKSFNMEQTAHMLVPGSCENVTSESKRSNNSGTGDMSDRITLYDEAPQWMVARQNDPRCSEEVAEGKARMSTGISSRKVCSIEPDPDNPDRQIRATKVLLDNVVGCMAAATNKFISDPATLSRVYNIPHVNNNDNVRKENQKIREAQRGESEAEMDDEKYVQTATVYDATAYNPSKYDMDFKKNYVKLYRFLQCSVALSFKLIYQTLLPKVNLDATYYVLGHIIKQLQRRGIHSVTHRGYSRVAMLTRVYTIVNAVMEVFGYENAECANMDRTLSAYIKTAPFLCATTQISVWAFTLMTKDHANPVTLGSLRALMAEKSFEFTESDNVKDTDEASSDDENIAISDDDLQRVQKMFHQKNGNFKRYRDGSGNVMIDLNYLMLPGRLTNMVQIVMGNTGGEFAQEDVFSCMYTLSRTNMEFTNAFAPCSEEVLQGPLDDVPRDKLSGPILSFVDVSEVSGGGGGGGGGGGANGSNDGDVRVDAGPRCYVNVHAYKRLSSVESLLENIIKSLGHKYSDNRVLITGIPKDVARADMKEVKLVRNAKNKMIVDNVAGFMRESEMKTLYSMQFHTQVENYSGKEKDVEADYEAFEKAVAEAKKQRKLKRVTIDMDIDEWAFEKHFATAGIPYDVDRNSNRMLWKKWNDERKVYESKPLPTPKNRMRDILALRQARKARKEAIKQRRDQEEMIINKRRRVEASEHDNSAMQLVM